MQRSAADVSVAEEALRHERTRAKAERSNHASEIERWRAALEAARAESVRYRQEGALGDLFEMSAAPPYHSPPPPPPVDESSEQSTGNGLLDRIVLTRHYDYFMRTPPATVRR